VGEFPVGGHENWQEHNINELRAEMQASTTDVLVHKLPPKKPQG